MKLFLCALLLLCLSQLAFAATLEVALDGSQAYTTIQSAINASAHGDVVLVYPGRYFENIRFYGKNITLASLEYPTGDTGYKYSTIIDGNQNGPVIRLGDGESSVVIRGFTITNGSGFYYAIHETTHGGGILIGAMTQNRSVSVINCLIENNTATNGGGIQAAVCYLTLSGTTIRSNHSSTGGGVFFSGLYSGAVYNTIFDSQNRCSIYNNFAANGSDMYFYCVDNVHVVVDTFSVATPSNFYASAVARNTNITNPYTFDILNHTHTEVNHDIFVAPWGDDSNSGTSPLEPMRSIFKAVYKVASDSLNPKTVHIAPGSYSPSLYSQIFPIPLKNNTRLQGESSTQCIIDAEGQTVLVSIPPHSNDLRIMGLSLINGRAGIQSNNCRDILIEDVAIDNITDIRLAHGISLSDNRDINISNVRVSNVVSNQSATGVYLGNSNGYINLLDLTINDCISGEWMPTLDLSIKSEGDVLLDRCKFYNNSNFSSDIPNTLMQITTWVEDAVRFRVEMRNSSFFDNYQMYHQHMASVRSWNDSLLVSNCTFASNIGGSSAVSLKGKVHLRNNIFWNPNLSDEIYINYYGETIFPSSSSFEYNNIRDGINGVVNGLPGNPMYWADNNLCLDPLFSGIGNHPYTLSSASPLIDMGMPNHEHLNLGDIDAGGNARLVDGYGDGIARIDIGAYEYQNMPAPYALNAAILDRAIYLQWQMPDRYSNRSGRQLSGYRIYRDGSPHIDLSDPSQLYFLDLISQSDTLSYVVMALYGYVESAPSNEVCVYIEVVSIDDDTAAPLLSSLVLAPNPFRSVSKISFGLKEDTELQIQIYNLRGQKVRSISREKLRQGEHHFIWQGDDDSGKAVGSGVYLLRLSSNAKTVMQRKLVYLK